MISELPPSSRIKWGYAVSRIPGRPTTLGEADIVLDSKPPRRGDVLLACVEEIGRHERMDISGMKKSALFVGDVVGVTFAPRYATRQFEAVVPDDLDELHFVCSGGICGKVVGAPLAMDEPTRLRPLGYLMRDGERVRTGDHRLPSTAGWPSGIPIVVVVGSSMDSGKTTAAFSLTNGLTRSGFSVAAAKVTGTASIKDWLLLEDAGAHPVFDFTAAGHGSTALLAYEEVQDVLETLVGALVSTAPDYVILEIADGITQRETTMLLDMLVARQASFVYTCNDPVGVRTGVSMLTERGLDVLCVSGTMTTSPLGVREARQQCSLPVLTREELCEVGIAKRLGIRIPRNEVALNLEGDAVSPQ